MLQKKSYDKIKKSVSQTYSLYNTYRSHDVKTLPFKFWSIVVLTAIDEEQKLAYQTIIEQKKIDNEIPKGADFLVFVDPEGPKIGSGGATMNVIYQLNEIYGDNLKNLFVLIINAGGFSQRMPSSSALGKIFMSVPFGSPVWQIFDLKLACYLPFLQKMNPGYFHASSDTIEIFDEPVLEEQKEPSLYHFRNQGLTALAHPSTVKIGTSHGVFVVDNQSLINNKHSIDDLPTSFLKCFEVLQKPTLQILRKKKAVLMTANNETFVYTDSCFYFDHDFAQKLSNFYNLEKPLTCEIDGYGDFMQCLGENASDKFVDDFRNVSQVTDSLKLTRTKLFNTLKGSNLNVIAFNQSEFFHLGTMCEYLDNFNPFGHLGKIINWKSVNFSFFNSETSNIADDVIIIESLFTKDVNIQNRIVIEYCEFNCPVEVGSNSIISSCYLDEKLDNIKLNIPSNCIIHTLPIKNKEGDEQYVTLIFNINDDLKNIYSEPEKVVYFGKALSDIPTLHSSCEVDIKMFYQNIFSLWNCKLFPSASNMHSSLTSSLKLIQNIDEIVHADLKNTGKFNRYSACEVMMMKDVVTMISHRNNLRKKISSYH